MGIELKGVDKGFGKKEVLKNVSLSIPDKIIFGIIGISGSGKTTLLKLMVGFYKPDKGSVLVNNKNIGKADIKELFGFATQSNCFYPKLTVEENLKYFGSLYGLDSGTIKKNIDNILNLVELKDSRDVVADNLSGGMQRRLDLACALVNNPKILILDEPTEDLDPALRKQMLSLIKKINSLGTTIILTSHLLGEVEHVCDEVAIIHNKRILEVGSVSKLRSIYGDKEEVHLRLASENYDKIIKNLDKKLINNFVKDEKCLIIETGKARQVFNDVMELADKYKEKILSIDIQKPNLEEIFEGLTKK